MPPKKSPKSTPVKASPPAGKASPPESTPGPVKASPSAAVDTAHSTPLMLHQAPPHQHESFKTPTPKRSKQQHVRNKDAPQLTAGSNKDKIQSPAKQPPPELAEPPDLADAVDLSLLLHVAYCDLEARADALDRMSDLLKQHGLQRLDELQIKGMFLIHHAAIANNDLLLNWMYHRRFTMNRMVLASINIELQDHDDAQFHFAVAARATLLHLCVMCTSTECLYFLVDKIDALFVDWKDDNGRTALDLLGVPGLRIADEVQQQIRGILDQCRQALGAGDKENCSGSQTSSDGDAQSSSGDSQDEDADMVSEVDEAHSLELPVDSMQDAAAPTSSANSDELSAVLKDSMSAVVELPEDPDVVMTVQASSSAASPIDAAGPPEPAATSNEPSAQPTIAAASAEPTSSTEPAAPSCVSEPTAEQAAIPGEAASTQSAAQPAIAAVSTDETASPDLTAKLPPVTPLIAPPSQDQIVSAPPCSEPAASFEPICTPGSQPANKDSTESTAGTAVFTQSGPSVSFEVVNQKLAIMRSFSLDTLPPDSPHFKADAPGMLVTSSPTVQDYALPPMVVWLKDEGLHAALQDKGNEQQCPLLPYMLISNPGDGDCIFRCALMACTQLEPPCDEVSVLHALHRDPQFAHVIEQERKRETEVILKFRKRVASQALTLCELIPEDRQQECELIKTSRCSVDIDIGMALVGEELDMIMAKATVAHPGRVVSAAHPNLFNLCSGVLEIDSRHAKVPPGGVKEQVDSGLLLFSEQLNVPHQVLLMYDNSLPPEKRDDRIGHMCPLIAMPQLQLCGVSHPLFTGSPAAWFPLVLSSSNVCWLTTHYYGWIDFNMDHVVRSSKQASPAEPWFGKKKVFLSTGSVVVFRVYGKDGCLETTKQGVVLHTYVRMSKTALQEVKQQLPKQQQEHIADDGCVPLAHALVWEMTRQPGDDASVSQCYSMIADVSKPNQHLHPVSVGDIVEQVKLSPKWQQKLVAQAHDSSVDGYHYERHAVTMPSKQGKLKSLQRTLEKGGVYGLAAQYFVDQAHKVASRAASGSRPAPWLTWLATEAAGSFMLEHLHLHVKQRELFVAAQPSWPSASVTFSPSQSGIASSPSPTKQPPPHQLDTRASRSSSSVSSPARVSQSSQGSGRKAAGGVPQLGTPPPMHELPKEAPEALLRASLFNKLSDPRAPEYLAPFASCACDVVGEEGLQWAPSSQHECLKGVWAQLVEHEPAVARTVWFLCQQHQQNRTSFDTDQLADYVKQLDDLRVSAWCFWTWNNNVPPEDHSTTAFQQLIDWMDLTAKQEQEKKKQQQANRKKRAADKEKKSAAKPKQPQTSSADAADEEQKSSQPSKSTKSQPSKAPSKKKEKTDAPSPPKETSQSEAKALAEPKQTEKAQAKAAEKSEAKALSKKSEKPAKAKQAAQQSSDSDIEKLDASMLPSSSANSWVKTQKQKASPKTTVTPLSPPGSSAILATRAMRGKRAADDSLDAASKPADSEHAVVASAVKRARGGTKASPIVHSVAAASLEPAASTARELPHREDPPVRTQPLPPATAASSDYASSVDSELKQANDQIEVLRKKLMVKQLQAQLDEADRAAQARASGGASSQAAAPTQATSQQLMLSMQQESGSAAPGNVLMQPQHQLQLHSPAFQHQMAVVSSPPSLMVGNSRPASPPTDPQTLRAMSTHQLWTLHDRLCAMEQMQRMSSGSSGTGAAHAPGSAQRGQYLGDHHEPRPQTAYLHQQAAISRRAEAEDMLPHFAPQSSGPYYRTMSQMTSYAHSSASRSTVTGGAVPAVLYRTPPRGSGAVAHLASAVEPTVEVRFSGPPSMLHNFMMHAMPMDAQYAAQRATHPTLRIEDCTETQYTDQQYL